jgi:DNA/RNA endonuclease YhcR with UshA esterase domain
LKPVQKKKRNQMINLRSASALMLAAGLLCISDGLTFADNPQNLTSGSKPSQSSVAAKGSFAIIDAYSALIKTATSAKDLKAATAFEGKQGTFTGTVTKVYAPSSNSIVVLDFDKDYDAAVTAVVKADDFKAFPDLSKLNGKSLVISGTVTEFRSRPQILLTAPNQIQVITGTP